MHLFVGTEQICLCDTTSHFAPCAAICFSQLPNGGCRMCEVTIRDPMVRGSLGIPKPNGGNISRIAMNWEAPLFPLIVGIARFYVEPENIRPIPDTIKPYSIPANGPLLQPT